MTRSNEEKQVNFVLAPKMSPREVVSFLLNRFPAKRDSVCPDEHCFEEPSRVYDSFAKEVIRGAEDPAFVDSVVSFIDELAASTDPLVREVLIIDLLEGIAEDQEVAGMISHGVSSEARTLLYEVERKVYGRTRPA